MTKATRQKAPDERAATRLDLTLAATATHTLAVSIPHLTALGEPVIQYPSSVKAPPQHPQHIKHTTKYPNHQPQNTHNTKRKRPNNPTRNSVTTGDNTSPVTQQNKDNPKETHAPKRTKRSHPHSLFIILQTTDPLH